MVSPMESRNLGRPLRLIVHCRAEALREGGSGLGSEEAANQPSQGYGPASRSLNSGDELSVKYTKGISAGLYFCIRVFRVFRGQSL